MANQFTRYRSSVILADLLYNIRISNVWQAKLINVVACLSKIIIENRAVTQISSDDLLVTDAASSS